MHTNKFEIKNILTRGMAVLAVFFMFTAQVNSQTVTITAPANGAVNVSTEPVISWATTVVPAGAGIRYTISLRNSDGSVEHKLLTTWNVSSIQWDPVGFAYALAINTEYRIIVTAAPDGNDAQAVSAQANFTTAAGVSTVNITYPTNGLNGVSTLPNFQWAPVALNAPVTYTLNVKQVGDAGAGVTVTPLINATNYQWLAANGALLYNTDYTCTLSYSDNNGVHAGTVSIASFRTRVQPTVTFNHPVNTLTGVSVLPRFTWTGTNLNAPVYRLIVTKAGEAVPAAIINAGFVPAAGGATAYQWTKADGALQNNTNYICTVDYFDGDAAGSSTVVSFKTVPAVNISLTNPSNLATGVIRSAVTFGWYGAIGAGSYRLQAIAPAGGIAPATEADWDNGLLLPTAITYTGTDNFFIANDLLPDTKYYWRVQALDADGVFINNSAVRSFITSGKASTPYLTFPINSQKVYTLEPTLYWWTKNYDPVNIFDIRIYDEAAPAIAVHQALSVTDQFYQVPAGVLLGGKTYNWTVTARTNAADPVGVLSATGKFKTEGGNQIYKPILSYPVNNLTIYSLSPTLYWYTGGTANGITYTVELYKSTAPGANLLATQPHDVIDQFQYDVPVVLEAGATYNWTVTASNGGVDPAQISAQGTFRVSSSLGKGKAMVSYPKGNQLQYSNLPTFYWYLNGNNTGIGGYRVAWWDITANGPAPVLDVQWNFVPTFELVMDPAATSYTMPIPLISGHKYAWAVVTVDAAQDVNGTWSMTGLFTVNQNIGKPVLSAPVGGATVYTRTPVLYWFFNGEPGSIDHFLVSYSPEQNFLTVNNPITGQPYTTTVPVASTESSFQVVVPLTAGATYWWKVQGVDAANNPVGSASTTGSFVVNMGSNVIVPIAGSPVDGINIANSAATLSWIIPSQPGVAMTYETQYATNPDMLNAVTVSKLTTPSADITGLQKGVNYYWRVRSVDANGAASAYSAPATFKVTGTTDVEKRPGVPAEFALDQNYPNPFNPSTVIRFSLPEESMVTLKIYDVMGQEVKTIINETMNAGSFDVQWNGDDSNGKKVQSGTYIYRIITENNSVARKMMLVK